MSHLALGLHAAAQPLTVLLASLTDPHTDAMQARELRELVDSSGAEVERVCRLFYYLQQLLLVESVPPVIALAQILPIVQQVMEGVQLLFEQDGIQLRLVLCSACPPLPVDRARVMQALFDVLQVAHKVSRKGDTVELNLSRVGERALRIVVQADPRRLANDPEPDEGELRLSMAVAEANICCQQGTCSWSLRPFHVDMQLQQLPNHGRGN